MSRQIFEYHPVLAFRFIPGIKARIQHEGGGYLLKSNNMGFRCDHDFIPHKSQRRILIFGDSFTAGDGISNGKRYTDLIEQNIPGLEVYNFGLPGTGTDQHYLAYKEYANKIDHDLLVISVFVENIRRVVAHYRLFQNEKGNEVYYMKPYFEVNEGKLELKNVPPSKNNLLLNDIPEDANIDRGGRFQTLRKIINKAGIKDLTQRITNYQPLPEYNKPDNHEWLLLKTIIKEWVTSHNKPVLISLIPLYQYTEQTSDPSHYQERFKELVNELGCYLHDPLEDYLTAYPLNQRREFRFAKDQHYTQSGHEALAKSLIPVISKILDKEG